MFSRRKIFNRFKQYPHSITEKIRILIFLMHQNIINFKLAYFIEREYNFFSRFNISFISADYLDLKKNKFKVFKIYNVLTVENDRILEKNDLVISGQGNLSMRYVDQTTIKNSGKKFYLLIKKSYLELML